MLSQEQSKDVQSLPFTAEEPRPTDTDGGGGSWEIGSDHRPRPRIGGGRAHRLREDRKSVV